MRLIISQFMSLDGVVQAPGGPQEDTDEDFPHGGCSMPYFDAQVMAGFIDEAMQETEALLFGRAKYVVWSTLTQDDLRLCGVYRSGQTPPIPDWEG